MFKKLLSALGVLALLVAPSLSKLPVKEDTLLKSVGVLQAKRGEDEWACTAFRLKAKRLVVTAGHCVEGVEEMSFILPTHVGANLFGKVEGWKVTLKHLDKTDDIAILVLEEGPTGPGLEVAREETKLGDEVWLIGYPVTRFHEGWDWDLSLTVRPGVLSGLFNPTNKALEGEQKFDTGILGSMSGGPILNKDGKVIGIGTSHYSQPRVQAQIVASPRLAQLRRAILAAQGF